MEAKWCPVSVLQVREMCFEMAKGQTDKRLHKMLNRSLEESLEQLWKVDKYWKGGTNWKKISTDDDKEK